MAFSCFTLSSLSGRKLKRFDVDLCKKLSSLQTLNLAENQLKSFPSSVEWKNLYRLDISDNCLKSLEFVEHMPKLKELRVEGNGLVV